MAIPFISGTGCRDRNEFLDNGPMNDTEHAEILKRRDTLDRVMKNYQFSSNGCMSVVFLMSMWFTGTGHSLLP